MLLQLAALFGESISGDVNLDGQLGLTNISASTPGWCGVKFKNDGTVWEIHGANGTSEQTQLDSSTDWITPNDAAQDQYEFKAEEVSASGSAISPQFQNHNGSGKGLSTWTSLGTAGGACYWSVDANANSKIYTWTITVSVRFSGGDVLASANYGMTSNIT